MFTPGAYNIFNDGIQGNICNYEEKIRFENLPDFIRLFAPKPVKSNYKITQRDIKEYQEREEEKINFENLNKGINNDVNDFYEPPDDYLPFENELNNEEKNDEEVENFWVAYEIEVEGGYECPELNANWLPNLDENGMPIIEKTDKKYLKPIFFNELLPKSNELYDLEKEKELFARIDKIKHDDIDNFRNDLIPEIKKLIRGNKQNIPLSLADRLKLPNAPSFSESLNLIILYWGLLSKYFEKNNEKENALILSLGIFYLIKDYESNYANTNTFVTKLFSITAYKKTCNLILSWASKPKPNCIELSKDVANDIIDFIENDFPLVNIVEDDYYKLNECLKINHKKGYRICSWILNSNYYKDYIDYTYKKVFDLIDKPSNISIKMLKQYSKEAEKRYSEFIESLHLKNSSIIVAKIIISLALCINPESIAISNLYQHASNFFYKYENLISSNETKKAKLELTAIALAINAFYCENKKLPESMEELSKWFGRELPKNRFTNEPYKLDFNSKHVIYNNGIDGKSDLSNEYTDDLYFDFTI